MSNPLENLPSLRDLVHVLVKKARKKGFPIMNALRVFPAGSAAVKTGLKNNE